MLRHVLTVLALAAAACSDLPFEPAGPEAAPDTSKPGPFPVGVRTITLDDPARVDAKGNPRRLVTEVWYPAVEDARGKAGASYDLGTILSDEQRANLADVKFPPLPTTAVRDAAPDKEHGPFPLIVFSHGQGGIRWQSTFYTVALASHGYVVVSPDHPGNTLGDALRDELDSLTNFEERPKDVTFLIDSFTDLAPGDALAGTIDAERIGATGHSYGALTSLRSAAFDERIDVIVPQAPPTADLAFAGKRNDYMLAIPTMVQAAHEDKTLPWDEHVAPTWGRLSGRRVLVDLVKGGHFTYSDLCAFDLADIAERAGFGNAKEALEDGCGDTSPPASIAQPLINHFAIAFFNATLRSSAGSWALIDQAHADAIAKGAATVTHAE